ncbi:lytic murein transglycosylase [Conexibacter sp. JD483]|uniref:lytic murein transglycosylase n=1 Tax=unclassified Conexibacter TaxID=2627773 RepID=UPI002724A554|nr:MULTISPECIES: lytic murein transglycosylase [unclassified Conexibacter]MDO8189205.1 lytic murein transglycosylase [Conexibacter sp. CPCC 205706]MDO8201345.1 lytic murein transglycosylase [Conexibacter sp. CPCC 205762]MDR9372264.1 lytic murein transglycosylase [Conexibacter sp. JD483]
MRRTTLRIASLAAGTAILIGGISSQASADKRLVTVTLAGGRIVTLTLDGTPGVPIDKTQLPDLGAPVLSISETPLAETPPQTQATATTPPATLQTNPIIPTTPTQPPAGTTGATGTTPGTTGTGTTPGTTGTVPGTTGTGTTPTTGTGTTRQPDAVGGIVTTGRGAKGRGGRSVPRTNAGSGGAGELTDANRDGTATPDETPDTPVQTEGAQPTPDTPGYTVAPTLDLTPAGVPNFFIEQFRIPPFLLPIYQAAAMQYGVPWQILAAINEIETDYGRNLSVSSAGALGWMQFMPGTWETYGVDANGDGQKDPYNPVDAIFAAARYLKAAGAESDLYKAIFAYNHADWYVESVLLRARVIGGMPADLVGSLTGLTQGRFPVAARSTYADSIDVRRAGRRITGSNAAVTVEGDADRRSINIFAARDAPVVAVNDGTIVKLGENDRLGRFVVLQDVYGNRFTYSHLGSLAEKIPVPKEADELSAPSSTEQEQALKAQQGQDTAPTAAASAGRQAATAGAADTADAAAARADARTARSAGRATAKADAHTTLPDVPQGPSLAKERLFANPSRPEAFAAGGERQLDQMGERLTTFEGYFSGPLEADPDDYLLKPLRKGSTVIAGTVLGRIDRTTERLAPHVEFTIQPAGRGAPKIDPKPILDGWKLLESTAIYKAGNDSVFGRDGSEPSIGQILLMTKQELISRVLSNPNIEIYAGGREDIRTGQIDRRVLATLEFLSSSGLKPTVTSLKGNHGLMTASGNVSEHSTGTAVDIGAINGIRIQPSTQGDGSITDITIRRLLTLQGTMKPHQIISLMSYPGSDNTLSLPDHDDHIHIGFHAVDPAVGATPRLQQILRPEQWTRLVDQLTTIENPVVPTSVSRYAIEDRDAR